MIIVDSPKQIRTLEDEINYCLIQLSTDFQPIDINQRYEEIESIIKSKLDSSIPPETQLKELETIFPRSENGTIYNSHYLRCLVYALLAERELSAKNESAGWALFVQANYHRGYMDGYLGDSNKLQVERKAAASQVGGKKTALAHSLIQQEAARLIAVKAPTTGWKNKITAIQNIQEELSKFICDQKLGKVVISPVDTLKKWMSQIPSIKESFEQHSAKRLSTLSTSSKQKK
jgi:hypothetical protein